MKKLLFLLMFLPMMANAQSKLSAVTLKNGTILQGVIKTIDPTDAVTIEIAGVETKIKMDIIQKIEEVGATSAISPTPADQGPLTNKLRVTDEADYPETFDLKVGSHTIKMILVRGGEMNMGYDGRHSLKYNSEPVHKVKVTSYYMSNEYIPASLVSEIDPSLSDKKGVYYSAKRYENMNEVVKAISQKTNLPIRVPTKQNGSMLHVLRRVQSSLKNAKIMSFVLIGLPNLKLLMEPQIQKDQLKANIM
jgi:hypothetical protein